MLRLKLVAQNSFFTSAPRCARILIGIYRYYSKVHSFLPFLPHSKDILFNMLSQTSEIVHYAFHGALLVFCNPEKYSTIPFRGSEIETSKTEYARTLSDLQHDSKSTQTPVDKLVVLQALLLMIFAAEFNSPATAGRHCISISSAHMLSRASLVTYSMMLTHFRRSWMVHSSIRSIRFSIR